MDKFKQEVTVLSVSRYHVVDNKTGEINEGTAVRYVFSTELTPVSEENLKGYKLGKASMPYEYFDHFSTTPVPAIYLADLEFSIASDGKVQVKAKDFEYKRALAVGTSGK